jgi:hypothetical protein
MMCLNCWDVSVVLPGPLRTVVIAADHACNLCFLCLLHVLLLSCYSR